MKTAYLGLGSNLRSAFGSPADNLAEAVRRIASDRLTVTRQSRIWKTAPRDVTDQPHFFNQVIEIDTGLLPRQLLERAKRIEREMGRDLRAARLAPKGPRVIDIDILLYGRSVIAAPDLEIPHPRILERKFVLGPLAELAPDLRHPVTGQNIGTLLKAVLDQDGVPIRSSTTGDI